MTSKIKVDNINKVSDDSNIIKKCGTTTTIGSGASNPIVVDGSAVTLGRCGGTVALASGATQTGFGRTGTVDWQTGSIKTSTFTATSGEGYFVNTTGGAITVNLPAGVAGAIVGLKDYAGTWGSNAVTLNPNGSDKIGGANDADPTLEVNGGAVLLVFVDSTQGWLTTQESVTESPSGVEDFIIATGGTETTSGDCKIHTFTGPGTFTVSQVASCATNNIVSHSVVAGGGGGGADGAGSGGAGGYREVKNPVTPYTASPLDGYPSAPNRVTVTAAGFPITVGGGGAGSGVSGNPGTKGSDSVFSSITSTGGGFGGRSGDGAAGPGGSGGGPRGCVATTGAGNTPPTSPSQGNPGGTNPTGTAGSAGGGGAATAGSAGSGPQAGPGGNGVTSEINASSVTRAGGGGGGNDQPGNFGVGGPGGGGSGGQRCGAAAAAGTTNTGGGGGGGGVSPPAGASGGSGIVIIRYKFQ